MASYLRGNASIGDIPFFIEPWLLEEGYLWLQKRWYYRRLDVLQLAWHDSVFGGVHLGHLVPFHFSLSDHHLAFSQDLIVFAGVLGANKKHQGMKTKENTCWLHLGTKKTWTTKSFGTLKTKLKQAFCNKVNTATKTSMKCPLWLNDVILMMGHKWHAKWKICL